MRTTGIPIRDAHVDASLYGVQDTEHGSASSCASAGRRTSLWICTSGLFVFVVTSSFTCGSL
jgi:hypothetical protein